MKLQNDRQLAKNYGTTMRTIRKWRFESAPLEDEAGMVDWLASRKNLPPQVMSGNFRTDRVKQDPKVAKELRQGSAEALRRLEKAEAAASVAYEIALKSGNALEIRTARKAWTEILEALRRFDLSVQLSRRDDEHVSRKEVTESLGIFVGYLHSALVEALRGVSPMVAGQPDAATVARILDQIPRNALRNTLNTAAAHTGGTAAGFPGWLTKALSDPAVT